MIAVVAVGIVAVLAGGAFASSETTSVVDTINPFGSVTLASGGSAPIQIKFTVTGRQENAATIHVYTTWTLNGLTFTGSNPTTVSVPARAATDPASVYTVDGTVAVTSGHANGGPYNLPISPYQIDTTAPAALGAGTPSTYSVTVLNPAPSDTTPPTVEVSTDNTVPTSGWFTTSPQQVDVSASDSSNVTSIKCDVDGGAYSEVSNEAGIGTTSASGDISVSGDGSHLVLCEATDGASPANIGAATGSTDTVTVNIDTTAPSVSGAPTSSPNSNGWYNSAVTIHWTCSDATSGVLADSCPSDSTISTEGSGETVNSGLVYDNAGNSNSADSSPGVNIDETAPTVDCSAPTPDYAGGGGWYASNQSVSCTASDGLSGLADSGESSFSLGPTTIAADSYGSQTLGPEDVYDNAGNSTSTGSFPLQIDRQAPMISDNSTTDTPTGFDGLLYWYDHPVTVNFSASDGGSGLASNCPSSWTAKTSSDGIGVTASSGSCADNVGNTNNGITSSGYNVDTVAPTVTVTGPTNGASYTLGSVPTAGCTTLDTLSGVQTDASPNVTGGNADGVGTFTATCSGGEDYAGNTAAPVSVTYSVAYHFSGFLAPVNNPTTVNTGKAGRTYPVKWQLTDANGNYISDLAAVTSVTYKSTTCGAFSTDSTDALETTATGGTSLRYDSTANQYVYNWATTSKGCYTLFLKLNDGNTYYAYFSLS